MNDELLCEVRDAALYLTINRPQRRNAITPGVLQGLRDGILRADREADIRAVVITGTGEQAFCAAPICRPANRSGSITRTPTRGWPTCSAAPGSQQCR